MKKRSVCLYWFCACEWFSTRLYKDEWQNNM